MDNLSDVSTLVQALRLTQSQVREALLRLSQCVLQTEVSELLRRADKNLDIIINSVCIKGEASPTQVSPQDGSSKEILHKEIDGLDSRRSGKVQQKELSSHPWEYLGSGQFSTVFKARLKGSTVAVKVLKTREEVGPLLAEGSRIRDLRHENIVAFRGMNTLEHDIEKHGLKAGSPFIVMEYISNNLYRYVESQKGPESKMIPKGQVWNFAQQIARGLLYLHGLNPPISHRDLKPDNILLDDKSMTVKLADLGLSESVSVSSSEGSCFEARWAAPEMFHSDAETPNYLFADIYSYGQVVVYMLTGKIPWFERNTGSVANIRNRENEYRKEDGKPNHESKYKNDDVVVIPKDLTGPLKEIILGCRKTEPHKRPSANTLFKKYFLEDKNPYQSEMESAEFFACGFLKDTQIFVADSKVDETSRGYFQTGRFPEGYPPECLLCKVEVGNQEYNEVPCEWDFEEDYRLNYAKFKMDALLKKIDDNPAIALKLLATPREGAEERQEILLEFGQTTYCHHRAMRKIWMELRESQKREMVLCKSNVHPIFSTSFGLHVAVLTADEPRRFIFARRANREGMATPGKFTCGAVESLSVKDCVKKEGEQFVDLTRTAARGLEEELRVELHGDDAKALCLSTVYLKFDTHEWGCCGFVDLSDERVAPERRLTFEQLRSRFSTGPKDKFEHEEVIAVDFDLATMTEFVNKNYRDFASSAKLVVVKVLQMFYGVLAVERAFDRFRI